MAVFTVENIPKPAENTFFVGHDAERLFLQKQSAGEHMHHALLFEGSQGIGKATLAFHFAYHLLSGDNAASTHESEAEGEPGIFWQAPCETSAVWRKIGQDSHPSLLYIRRTLDPKSRKLRNAITVDDIRRVSRFLQQTASDNGKRIVIIDAADDMNRNAANALLKTLEEPPAKVLFILISHNAGKLLPTIRSRCQWLRFKPLSNANISRILSHFAAKIGCDSEISADNENILLAEGSVSRALSLLTANIAEYLHKIETMLQAGLFQAPSAQSLAEELSKRDNDSAYALIMQSQLDFLYKKAQAAALENKLSQAAAMAEFCNLQEQAFLQAQAFNLDKKQFMLVFLQQMYTFLHQ